MAAQLAHFPTIHRQAASELETLWRVTDDASGQAFLVRDVWEVFDAFEAGWGRAVMVHCFS